MGLSINQGPNHQGTSETSRRDFLKHTSGTLAGASLASAIATRSYAAEDNTIKVALVGCGGRGTGAAANALGTSGPTQLYAVADLFAHRMEPSLKKLGTRFGKQAEVPSERQFLGLDAFQKAIDAVSPGGVVLLTTPPAFRPIHMQYAVEKNCHIFMEKSFAVDAPGIRRVMQVGELATQKNLKIAGGLMSRHYRPLEDAIRQIHDGAIGDVITCWAYREHGPVGFKPRFPEMTELGHQIQNYNNFTWVNGSFILDWLIHNLDICCWVKDAWPVSAQGQGGRQARTQPDQLFDHYAVEYTFPDGTRLFAQGRHMASCWGFFGDVIHGSKGCAVLGEGQPDPKLYEGYNPTAENLIWRFEGEKGNAYDREHQLLFEAIRKDLPYNETQRCARAAMTGILGRMAAESGKEITWDDALASNVQLAPGLENFAMDSEAPVVADADGKYPVAMPGFTDVL